MPTSARSLLRGHPFVPALVMASALLLANIAALPHFGNPETWIATLTVFAPFALVAMAATPAVLTGGGGLDLSVGPLAALVNLTLVTQLLGGPLRSPWFSIPICLALGAAVGMLNGFAVAYFRYPPVIATLCAFLVIIGVAFKLAGQPVAAPPGNWTAHLAHHVGPLPGPAVPIVAVLLAWWLITRTPYHGLLLAVGGDDAAAFSAGVQVARVRVIAYGLGGLFSSVAGLSLTALAQSADPNVGPAYALIALAAVAVGGTPLGRGGRGGLIGSFLGAIVLYLLQNLLSEVNVAATWNQVAYGALLLGGILVGAALTAPPKPKAALRS